MFIGLDSDRITIMSVVVVVAVVGAKLVLMVAKTECGCYLL